MRKTTWQHLATFLGITQNKNEEMRLLTTSEAYLRVNRPIIMDRNETRPHRKEENQK